MFRRLPAIEGRFPQQVRPVQQIAAAGPAKNPRLAQFGDNAGHRDPIGTDAVGQLLMGEPEGQPKPFRSILSQHSI